MIEKLRWKVEKERENKNAFLVALHNISNLQREAQKKIISFYNLNTGVS